MVGVICPSCGHENAADQRFCVSCGTELRLTCSSCGESNPPGARFCGACGTQLEQTVAPKLTEERRLVTILFADISGFTSHARERDPEEVTSMVDSCMAKLGAIVERYDGTVDKVIGDALMATFGAPTAHEDDPERAVRAALEMHKCADEFADEFAGLSLRVGVNTGEVMFAPVGPGEDRAFTVMGDAVNVAERLQSAAPRGGVLVGESSRRLASDAIRFGDPVTVKVKESDEPFPGWPAVEAADAPTERRMRAGKLVGRDREIERLCEMWTEASERLHPQLATVFGPAGIGKTRLATELVGLIEADGGRGLRGRSLPYGEKSGYWAFAEQIKTLAGIYETDTAEEARAKLDARVADLVEKDPAGISSRLATLAGLGSEGPADSKDALYLAARQFVAAIGRDQPTVFVFEDIQWADESLLDLIIYLAARVRDVPVLFLSLARLELRDRRPDWGGGLESFAAFRLEPLSHEESVAQISSLLQGAPDDVATEVARRAEGNPLFAEELVASLGEDSAASAQNLPDSIRGIIAARIDALPPTERSVILDASVVGKTFWRGVLESFGTGDGSLGEALDALERRDLLRRETSAAARHDEEFTFKHMLIRDVAYETLPRSARRERHGAVARYIESHAGDRVAEYAAQVAHHLELAGDLERATEYLLMAAEQARRSGARAEAVSLYSAALEHIPEDDLERRRTARACRAVTLVELGDLETSVVELDDLIDELEGQEKFEALRARSHAAGWRMQAEEARQFSQRGLDLATQLGRTDLQAVALGQQAFATAMDGRTQEAVDLDEKALAIWQEDEFESELAEIQAWTGLHKHWLGGSAEAIDHARASLELGRKTSSVYGIVGGGSHLGLALTGVGRHEEALEALEEVLEEARDIELQPILTSRLMNILAGTLHELHETERALDTNHEAIEAGKRASFNATIISGKVDLLYADLRAGEVGSAEVAWPGLWESAEASKGWHQWLWMTRLMAAKAQTDLAAGRPEAAVDQARSAIELADRYRRLKYVCLSRLTLGDALLELGRAEEAVPETRRSLAEAEALGHPPTLWQASAMLGKALLATGDDTGAEASFTQSKQTLERFVAGLQPERQERFLTAPPIGEVLKAAAGR